MAEYIEREALKNEIATSTEPFNTGSVFRAINRQAAADVAPVMHGRWSDAGFGELPKHAPYGWACSACGGISFNNEYIYCPNCGAKMDGGNENV